MEEKIKTQKKNKHLGRKIAEAIGAVTLAVVVIVKEVAKDMIQNRKNT